MNPSPFDQSNALHVGAIDFVSPREMRVAIDIDAPESIALNSGTPRAFPRVNSYLLVPVDRGLLVGQVEWMTIERSPFPKRRGLHDFGLVDLPYPLRSLRLNPLGILSERTPDQFIFERGAEGLPPIGAPVLLPTNLQLRAILKSTEHSRVRIGSSPIAGDADVFVDPDRLFGRHLAVLGNTGGGKSCSVAGLIRWSIEEAGQELLSGTGRSAVPRNPNARFIILDPNGEYSRAFSDDDPTVQARIFRVQTDNDQDALTVPLWFWNYEEWCSFTQASAKTQKPTLLHALQFVREGLTEATTEANQQLRRFLQPIVTIIRKEIKSGTPWGEFPKSKSFYEKIEKWKTGLEPYLNSVTATEQHDALQALVLGIDELCRPRRRTYAHHDFTLTEVKELLALASDAHSSFGGTAEDEMPLDVDSPLPFKGSSLLRAVDAAAEMLNVSEHVESLVARIRTLMADARMTPIMGGSSDVSLEDWLADYIGGDDTERRCVSIIDLSLVPSNVVHIIAAVVARIVFEALQRYVKLNSAVLPTVLVMEEAHTFIKRYKSDVENLDAAVVCCRVFERIAREGRKFGLGLILSSQRPSELSPTVLSQCNTFLLHRISNDRDQEIVHRLVPDSLRGLLRELPLLPSQSAILLGWASELPVLLRMRHLPKTQQPRSDDPDFWDVWTHKEAREVDWAAIAKDWQSRAGTGKKGGGVGRETSFVPDSTTATKDVDDDLPF